MNKTLPTLKSNRLFIRPINHNDCYDMYEYAKKDRNTTSEALIKPRWNELRNPMGPTGLASSVGKYLKVPGTITFRIVPCTSTFWYSKDPGGMTHVDIQAKSIMKNNITYALGISKLFLLLFSNLFIYTLPL